MPAQRWPDLLQRGNHVSVTCRGDAPGTARSGYVGTVSEASFQLGEVMNPYEHFSNLSEDPVLRYQDIAFADVLQVTVR